MSSFPNPSASKHRMEHKNHVNASRSSAVKLFQQNRAVRDPVLPRSRQGSSISGRVWPGGRDTSGTHRLDRGHAADSRAAGKTSHLRRRGHNTADDDQRGEKKPPQPADEALLRFLPPVVTCPNLPESGPASSPPRANHLTGGSYELPEPLTRPLDESTCFLLRWTLASL